MPTIHPSALVGPEAELADTVNIGPNCIVNGRVKLGKGVRLVASVHLEGPITIGDDTIVYPFACLGFPGQDFKFKLGSPTAGVVIGRGCLIREAVTIHAATNEHTPTTIGDRVFMMANSHAGHDASVGNGVVMVNNSALGGHAQAHDGAILSGAALVHQFNRIGRLAFMAGGTAVSVDVPPFCMVTGNNIMHGINLVGLRRSGMGRDDVTTVRRAYREVLSQSLPRAEMIAELERIGAQCPPVMEIARFVASAKKICQSAGRARQKRDATINDMVEVEE
jgi:UDP-N-acetylglucosamine acyltransferase